MKKFLFFTLILFFSSCQDNSYITIPGSIVFEGTYESDLVIANITNEFDTKIRQDTLSLEEKRELRYIWDRNDNEKNRVVDGIYFVNIFSEGKNRTIGKGMVVVD